jgi:hypothetical protein
MASEPPYHDGKTTLTNEEVASPTVDVDVFTRKTAVTENGAEATALDPRANTTDAYVIPR